MTEIRNQVLYKLQTEDILAVADDQGIPREKITPEVISLVVKGWESGLQWYEVTQTALDNALEIVSNK